MPGSASVFAIVDKKRKLLFKCRVLSTRKEITQGIMHSPRKFAPSLFVFPRASRWRNAIHSLFCPPFDAVFVSERHVVTDVLQISPNKLFVMPSEPAKYLLELPAGEAGRKKVKKGDKLQFEFR